MANQRGSPAQCTTHDNMAWQHAREAITKHMQRENTERKKKQNNHNKEPVTIRPDHAGMC